MADEGLGSWFDNPPGAEYAGIGGDPTMLAEYLKK